MGAVLAGEQRAYPVDSNPDCGQVQQRVLFDRILAELAVLAGEQCAYNVASNPDCGQVQQFCLSDRFLAELAVLMGEQRCRCSNFVCLVSFLLSLLC